MPAAKKAPAKKAAAPAKKAAPKTAEQIKREFFVPNYTDIAKAVDQKFKLTAGTMSMEARRTSTISTGLLCLDLMAGGGLRTGSWNTFLGGEGSAKSTALATIKLSAVSYNVPLVRDYDFEGAADPRYYEGIMEFHSKLKKLTDLYGLQDDKGRWVINPKAQYMDVSVAEDFFDPVAALMRRLPGKQYVEGKWWYVWDASKEGRAAAGSNYSKAMFSRYKKLFVEAENGMPQGIFFVDSYPAMYPAKLDEDDKGAGLAAAARALSENIPKIWSKLRGKGVIVVGVNQLRQKPMSMGDPWVEPAGEAVKFASGVRWRQTARVPPHSSPDVKNGVEKEDSVLYQRARDTYRYIHFKNTKNKYFTPYMEFWQRVWVDDGSGMAHGFDPVYDTLNYLKYTGQLLCPERFNGKTMMRLQLEGLPELPISYMDFKALVLLKGADLGPTLQKLKLPKNPMLRERCFAQIRSGKGSELMFYTIANPPEKVKAAAADGEEDEEFVIEDEE